LKSVVVHSVEKCLELFDSLGLDENLVPSVLSVRYYPRDNILRPLYPIDRGDVCAFSRVLGEIVDSAYSNLFCEGSVVGDFVFERGVFRRGEDRVGYSGIAITNLGSREKRFVAEFNSPLKSREYFSLVKSMIPFRGWNLKERSSVPLRD